MNIQVTKVKAIKRYQLYVHFSDGTEGVLDLAELAGKGVFKIWDEANLFEKVFIDEESKAITWPGELDIDTINAYCTINNISPENLLIPNTSYA